MLAPNKGSGGKIMLKTMVARLLYDVITKCKK